MNNKIIGQDGGGGGGGGEQHTPVDAPNTLHSRTTARVKFLIGEGENFGLADQTNPLKSVFFNNTPVQNSDGSFNFTKTSIAERYGLPSQTILTGYPGNANTFTLGQKITTSTPISHTTSSGIIDAVRVTIRFPALFAQATNGDTNGTSVSFEIYTKLGAGSFGLQRTVTVNDKSSVTTDLDYYVVRPGTTGVWTVKVVRITADNVSNTVANDTYFQFATELQNTTLTYDNSAIIGLTTSSETTGSSYPTVSFDYKGRKIKIPSNYTVATRSYSGPWNGAFKATPEWCDNPAWVLYDILTNDRYGMGFDPADIDQYSFYDAAVYNDGAVPALVNGSISGTEPRYTFNWQFMELQDAWDLIQGVAASFGAVVYTSGNRVKLVQDRPIAATRLITNSNVVDGMFEYTSSQLQSRITAAVVYWSNPAENNLSTPAFYEDTAAVTRYGFNQTSVSLIGGTTEGQAMRHAKWLVDTSVNNAEAVTFKVGPSLSDLEPGEVVKLMDSDYAEVTQEAKVVSTTSSTITIDRAITFVSGNTFDVVGSDGITLETRTLSSSGTSATMSFSGAAITAIAGSTFVLTGTVSPRLFKILNVKEDSLGVYSVAASQYDNNKFARVDNTPLGIVPTYVAPIGMNSTGPVTGINFAEESCIDQYGNPQCRMVVRWTAPTGTLISYYNVFVIKDYGTPTLIPDVQQPYCTFPVGADGTYSVNIYAVNAKGVQSPAVSASVVVNLTSPSGGSLLLPVTALQVVGGGTSFSGTSLDVQWTDGNVTGPNGTVAAYEVQVKDAATPSIVYRTEEVLEPKYTYDLIKQQTDNGANLKRSVIISVKVKDTWSRLSSATAVTFANATPAAVTGVVVTPSFKGNNIKWAESTDPDVQGYLVWRGSSAGFTPSGSNLVFDAKAISFSDSGLADGTTYYYKFAAYDVFGKSTSGTGLNVSSATSGLTLAGASTNEYHLNGVTWTPNSPSANSVAWTACTAIKTTGTGSGTTWSISAGNAAWTSGILYIYYVEGATTLSSTTTLATAIADNKVIVATYRGGTNLEYGDGKAFIDGSYVIAGTVGASQLVTGTAVITQTAQMANAIITGAKIDSATISNAHIANATIETLKLKNGAISDTIMFKGTSTYTANSTPNMISFGGGLDAFTWTCPSPVGVTGPFKTFVSVFVPITRTGGGASVGYKIVFTSTIKITGGSGVQGKASYTNEIAYASNSGYVLNFSFDAVPGTAYTIDGSSTSVNIGVLNGGNTYPTQTTTAGGMLCFIQTVFK